MKKLLLALCFMTGIESVQCDKITSTFLELSLLEGENIPVDIGPELLFMELLPLLVLREYEHDFELYDKFIKYYIAHGCDINKPCSREVLDAISEPAKGGLEDEFSGSLAGKTLLEFFMTETERSDIRIQKIIDALLANGAVYDDGWGSVQCDQRTTIILEEDILEGTISVCVESLFVEFIEQSCEYNVNFEAFDNVVKYFIKHGCDINKPFSASMFEKNFPSEFARDKGFIQDLEGKTLLAIFYSQPGDQAAEMAVKALLANGAV